MTVTLPSLGKGKGRQSHYQAPAHAQTAASHSPLEDIEAGLSELKNQRDYFLELAADHQGGGHPNHTHQVHARTSKHHPKGLPHTEPTGGGEEKGVVGVPKLEEDDVGLKSIPVKPPPDLGGLSTYSKQDHQAQLKVVRNLTSLSKLLKVELGQPHTAATHSAKLAEFDVQDTMSRINLLGRMVANNTLTQNDQASLSRLGPATYNRHDNPAMLISGATPAPAPTKNLISLPKDLIHQRRVDVYERHSYLVEQKLKSIEDSALQREEQQSLASRMALQEIEGAQRMRSSMWVSMLMIHRVMKVAREQMEMRKAASIVVRRFLPRWRRRQALRQRELERQQLVQERLPTMRTLTVEELRAVPVLSTWPYSNLDRLLGSVRPLCYKDDELMGRHGDPQDYVWFLSKGCACASFPSGRASPFTPPDQRNTHNTMLNFAGTMNVHLESVREHREGCLVGLESIPSETKLLFSYRTSEDTDTWAWEADTFRTELKAVLKDQEAKGKKEVATELQQEGRRVRESIIEKFDKPNSWFLKERTTLFKGWPTEQAEQVVSKMTPFLTFDPPEILFNQNDQGDCMYFVASGSVRLTQTYDQKEAAPWVDLVSAGGYFGQNCCLFLEPRSYTAVTTTHCDLWVLKKQDLVDLLFMNPNLYLSTKRIANTIRTSSMRRPEPRYFRSSQYILAKREASLGKSLQALKKSATAHIVGASEAIVSRGERVKCLYFILSGSARWSSGISVGPGEVIGDTQMMKKEETWGDCLKAESKVEMWVITKASIDDKHDKDKTKVGRGIGRGELKEESSPMKEK